MPKKPAVSAQHAEPSAKISARGVARLQGRHPWVYRSDVADSNGVPPGSLVRVLDERGKFLGTALYSSSSQIAIRLISHGSVADLPALVAERIRAGIGYRKGLVSNTDAYRIIFSEYAKNCNRRESWNAWMLAFGSLSNCRRFSPDCFGERRVRLSSL